MNYNSLEIGGFNITTDTSLQDEKYNITPEIKHIVQEMYIKTQKGKPNIIKQLKKYCKRYPQVPQFKNYLGVAYEKAGLQEKMMEVNRQALKEHPDYLFGKLNYANILLSDGRPEEVPDLLGEKMNLKALYPDRDTFHLREALGFFRVCVKYYLALDQMGKVEPYLRTMNKIGPDEPETEDAQNAWLHHIAKRAARQMKEEHERRRSVKSRSYDKSVQTDQKPVFNHPEIEMLYSDDMRIDHRIIREILELPRGSLIKDLEEVVEDSIRRFEYFWNLNGQYGEWREKEFSFIYHALFLLAELKAEESLPVVLQLFRQGEELLEFWFSDTLAEIGVEVFYFLGQNQLDELKAFMKEPDNYLFARNAVHAAVAQIALHQPARRSEVVEWYRQVFQFFLENPDDDRIIDTDVISFMVWNGMDFEAMELKEIIQDLYEHHFVERGIVGTLDKVLQAIESGKHRAYKYEMFDIYSRYDHLVNTWYSDEHEKSTFEAALEGKRNKQQSQNQPVKISQKVGRNDPCPCGSGKKYKYCCME